MWSKVARARPFATSQQTFGVDRWKAEGSPLHPLHQKDALGDWRSLELAAMRRLWLIDQADRMRPESPGYAFVQMMLCQTRLSILISNI
jgi:hypothetical protein